MRDRRVPRLHLGAASVAKKKEKKNSSESAWRMSIVTPFSRRSLSARASHAGTVAGH